MTSDVSRPYLIIPFLVRQSTWGGNYIVAYKNIRDAKLQAEKIGQSYELYGKSVLSLATDTSDPDFMKDVVAYNNGALSAGSESVLLDDLIKQNSAAILGPAVKHPAMPLLLKFTQASGNSFQLHVKKSGGDERWKSKPESWYYLEDGLATFGIKKDADLALYKETCLEIEQKLMELSHKIKTKELSHEKARELSQSFIREKNPWRFVNTHRVKKHSIIDLSPGGLHHSWEEDPVRFPLGNVVFEIQLDVSDEDSTIRAFDKGKMNKNGDIRTINIEDYFKYLDTNPKHNDLLLAFRKRSGSNLLSTPYYSLDILHVTKEADYETDASFIHLFVVEGAVEVESSNQTISVDKGFSCIIPHATGVFSLSSTSPNTTVLKSYLSSPLKTPQG